MSNWCTGSIVLDKGVKKLTSRIWQKVECIIRYPLWARMIIQKQFYTFGVINSHITWAQLLIERRDCATCCSYNVGYVRLFAPLVSSPELTVVSTGTSWVRAVLTMVLTTLDKLGSYTLPNVSSLVDWAGPHKVHEGRHWIHVLLTAINYRLKMCGHLRKVRYFIYAMGLRLLQLLNWLVYF